MAERYPDDATLLALTEDPATGVEYIPTGRSPYYLEFRKLVQRTLLASGRANDFRVYADGELSVGVRAGRGVIHNAAIDFAGVEGLALPNNAVTELWLDSAGAVQTGANLPADRTSYIPLARVTTATGQINEILDRRGEALFAVADAAGIGLTAAPTAINQALDGISADVTAAALNALTAGWQSDADHLHHHRGLSDEVDDETLFRISNDSAGPAAGVGLELHLPTTLAAATALVLDPQTGWLMQRQGGEARHLLGTVHVAHLEPGALASDQLGWLAGVVPVSGAAVDLVLSVGQSLVTDEPADAVEAAVHVNGVELTTTRPAIAVSDGSSFRSTGQGHGTAGAIRSDGVEQLQRGDLITVDLRRLVSGNVTSEATDVAALLVIRAGTPG